MLKQVYIKKPAIIIFEPVVYEKEKRATNSPVIATIKPIRLPTQKAINSNNLIFSLKMRVMHWKLVLSFMTL